MPTTLDGTFFLTKTKPLASKVADGVFQLQLFTVDRQGPHKVEPHRFIWTGPPAQLFWNLREDALLAGTPLQVHAHNPRAHATGRSTEIVSHVISCEISPQRFTDKREQLEKQEQEA